MSNSETRVKKFPVFKVTADFIANNPQCSICLDDFIDDADYQAIRLPCGHSFCYPHPQRSCFEDMCILTWLDETKNCPECRFKIIGPLSNHSDKDIQRYKDLMAGKLNARLIDEFSDWSTANLKRLCSLLLIDTTHILEKTELILALRRSGFYNADIPAADTSVPKILNRRTRFKLSEIRSFREESQKIADEWARREREQFMERLRQLQKDADERRKAMEEFNRMQAERERERKEAIIQQENLERMRNQQRRQAENRRLWLEKKEMEAIASAELLEEARKVEKEKYSSIAKAVEDGLQGQILVDALIGKNILPADFLQILLYGSNHEEGVEDSNFLPMKSEDLLLISSLEKYGSLMKVLLHEDTSLTVSCFEILLKYCFETNQALREHFPTLIYSFLKNGIISEDIYDRALGEWFSTSEHSGTSQAIDMLGIFHSNIHDTVVNEAQFDSASTHSSNEIGNENKSSMKNSSKHKRLQSQFGALSIDSDSDSD
jgi:hypothetical protein